MNLKIFSNFEIKINPTRTKRCFDTFGHIIFELLNELKDKVCKIHPSMWLSFFMTNNIRYSDCVRRDNNDTTFNKDLNFYVLEHCTNIRIHSSPKKVFDFSVPFRFSLDKLTLHSKIVRMFLIISPFVFPNWAFPLQWCQITKWRKR